ncbi:unnamed protein product [Rotaria magnacalcarata]|uniref:Uncharacterized protein n=1 Tax=Rotaria magnacalcarata TaxID=392030 RepID=A0A816S6B9_9BILA|nr:unnamed protein product [Rotaria magnacalcarata]CAF4171197.1 unnamed protein product [Rotaria magnacalcarata]
MSQVLRIAPPEAPFASKIYLERERFSEPITNIYILELACEMFYLIISFNQPIDYLIPRPEYIRVIIIEWLAKSSTPIARIISPDTQRSLLSARRCEGLDGYSQQAD